MAKQSAVQQATNSFNPLKKGHDSRKDSAGGGAGWFNMKSGDVERAVFLAEPDDIVSCSQVSIWFGKGKRAAQWVYTGPEDPFHDLGLEPKAKAFKAFIPVLVDGEPKVWTVSKTVHKAILDVADASGELRGLEAQLKRTGAELQTKYSIVPTGKRKDVDSVEEIDVVPMLGPLTTEGVREYLTEFFGEESYEAVVEKFVGSGPGAMSPKSTKKEEDLTDDDLDLES